MSVQTAKFNLGALKPDYGYLKGHVGRLLGGGAKSERRGWTSPALSPLTHSSPAAISPWLAGLIMEKRGNGTRESRLHSAEAVSLKSEDLTWKDCIVYKTEHKQLWQLFRGVTNTAHPTFPSNFLTCTVRSLISFWTLQHQSVSSTCLTANRLLFSACVPFAICSHLPRMQAGCEILIHRIWEVVFSYVASFSTARFNVNTLGGAGG